MSLQRHSLPILLAGSLLIGCSRSLEQPTGTGAKECAQAYYDTLIKQDWPRAYAILDPESRERCASHRFSRLALSYPSGLGFEPDTVHIRACDERGTEATAHVILTGRAGVNAHRYKDAITLHRGEDGWRVVLPSNFGKAKKR